VFARALLVVLVVETVACRRVERDLVRADPAPASAAGDAAEDGSAFRVDSARASRAVIRVSSYMQRDRESGSTLHTFLDELDVPALGCAASDDACVWRFLIRLPRPGTGLGPAIVETCEVHAHSGAIRCTFELNEPSDWRAAGNAFDVSPMGASSKCWDAFGQLGDGIEERLWAAVFEGGDRLLGSGLLDDVDVAAVVHLHERCNGWWTWDDAGAGLRFCARDEWLERRN
jgi:hypothetical protein